MRQAMTSDSALQAARMRLAGGQADAAAAACHALLLANPADADARHLFGRCLAALGRLEDAAAEFQRTLAVRADHYPTLVDLGVTYSVLGNHRDAQRVLMAAHAADSRPAEVHFALGLCRLGLGDLAGAEEGFRGAIARNPRFPDAHNNLGLIFDRRGQLDEA